MGNCAVVVRCWRWGCAGDRAVLELMSQIAFFGKRMLKSGRGKERGGERIDYCSRVCCWRRKKERKKERMNE